MDSPGGARWVDEIVRGHANLWDLAVAIAPYPVSRDQRSQRESAREVMQVNRPIMYVEFLADEFCNAAFYKEWFQQFELGMENEPSTNAGCRRETFGFFVVEGVHADAQRLFQTFDFGNLSNRAAGQFWEAALGALGVGGYM